MTGKIGPPRCRYYRLRPWVPPHFVLRLGFHIETLSYYMSQIFFCQSVFDVLPARLAKLFSITSVSLWRLGTIPNLTNKALHFNALEACA